MTGPRASSGLADGARAPSTGGPVAGWYVDPERSDRVRWYDGAAWTTHVRPAPSAATGPASTPVVAPGRPGVRTRSAVSPRASRLRLLVVVAVVLGGLLALNGVLRLAADARVEELQAPARQLSLAAAAPESLAGLTTTPGSATSELRTATIARLRPVWRLVPDAATVRTEAYRAATSAPAAGGTGEVTLAWTSTRTPFSQDAVARRFADAALAKTAGTATSQTRVDGAVVVCAEPARTGTPPPTMCAWVRSATGVLVVAQDGATADELRDDLVDAVERMAR